MTILVRLMSVEDLDCVMGIAEQSAEAPRWRRDDYRRVLSADSGAMVQHSAEVAFLSSSLAGFAVTTFLRGEPFADLETLAVHQSFRRRGAGSALLQYSLAFARRCGARGIRLEVRESNLVAIELYRKLAFRQAGRRLAYYSQPVEDALLFESDPIQT